MTQTPSTDTIALIATQPEHSSTCFRLIRPGQIYYLTVDSTVLCEDCALIDDIIRVREDLVIEVKRDRLLIQRGKVEMEVFPNEIRHLVNALTEAAARLVDKPSAD